jgi:hypothetical protein
MSTTTRRLNPDTERLLDDLYERFGKPLEAGNVGRLVAISRNGGTILGDDLADVTRRATVELGHGFCLFRLGAAAVGRWR